MPHDRPQPLNRPESPAVATRIVVFAAVGFLVFVGISLVVLRVYYGDEIKQSVFVPPTAFAKPQLQTNDVADLAKLQSEQRRRLSGYAWVDRENGIVRIPIEEAMKQIAKRSPDAYAPLDSAAPANPPAGAGGEKPQ